MQIPEKGFYKHYKHNPLGEFGNYIYEVVGIARHTEEKTYMVLYRPVYMNDWMGECDYQARPLEMFVENVEKDGKVVPRFEKIIDDGIIEKLEQIKVGMYKV
jgi:hypothetical protein